MDETDYRISAEDRRIHVSFDLRSDESCFIELSFSEDDALAIINMKHLGKKKIEVESIGGTASLPEGRSLERKICLAYANKEAGTVFYPYEKLSTLLSTAFSDLSRL